MINGLEIQVEGRYRMEVSDGEGNYKDYGWFKNMILDSGIYALLESTSSSANMLRYISVGSGTTPPTPGDTLLENIIATTRRNETETSGYDAAGGYGWTRRSVQFDAGEAAGNLGEVGAGGGLRGADLLSRALIKDRNGNPIIITVQSHEFLTVTFEVRRWWMTPPPYTLTYDDEGVPTTVTVTHAEPLYTNANRGASAGVTSSRFRINGSNTERETPVNGVLNWSRVFGLTESNPEISTLSTTIAGGAVPEVDNLITFTPPIAKTAEDEVTIYGSLTITRRS